MDKFGKLVSLLILPLVAEVVYSALMGYLFKATPEWGFEVTLFLYGVLFMLGSAYTYMKKGHVAVEVLTAYLSEEKKRYLSIFSEIVVLCVTVLVVLVSTPAAYRSMIMGERSTLQTPFNPYVWWYRWVIPISCALIAVQAAVQLVRLLKNKQTEEKEDK